MQKIATWVFTCASIAFGVLGLLFVLTFPDVSQKTSALHILLTKLLTADVFIILPSFALSVAGKYLNGNTAR